MTEPKPCTCGDLSWTKRLHGRITHKHACPVREDDWCQSHPEGGCKPNVPPSDPSNKARKDHGWWGEAVEFIVGWFAVMRGS